VRNSRPGTAGRRGVAIGDSDDGDGWSRPLSPPRPRGGGRLYRNLELGSHPLPPMMRPWKETLPGRIRVQLHTTSCDGVSISTSAGYATPKSHVHQPRNFQDQAKELSLAIEVPRHDVHWRLRSRRRPRWTPHPKPLSPRQRRPSLSDDGKARFDPSLEKFALARNGPEQFGLV
jgi:hypothetical protein